MPLLNLNFYKPRIALTLIFFNALSLSILAQGYIVEIQGTWKKSNGTIVENRQKVSAGTRISKVSTGNNDSIYIAGHDGDILISCTNDCASLVVPRTAQSWGEYFLCKIIGCGSTRYTTFGAKGVCANPDTLASLDQNGSIDLSNYFRSYSRTSEKVVLEFQKKRGDLIEKKSFEIKTSSPQIEDLETGLYGVMEGSLSSRILILPIETYDKEKKGFSEIYNKVEYWKKQHLSNCTIKSFTQSYLDYVAEKYESEIKRGRGKTRKSH